MRIVHNRCHFFDKQVVKMQARPAPSRPGLRAAGHARRRAGGARCFASADAAGCACLLGWVLLQGGGGRAAHRDGTWCRRAGRIRPAEGRAARAGKPQRDPGGRDAAQRGAAVLRRDGGQRQAGRPHHHHRHLQGHRAARQPAPQGAQGARAPATAPQQRHAALAACVCTPAPLRRPVARAAATSAGPTAWLALRARPTARVGRWLGNPIARVRARGRRCTRRTWTLCTCDG